MSRSGNLWFQSCRSQRWWCLVSLLAWALVACKPEPTPPAAESVTPPEPPITQARSPVGSTTPASPTVSKVQTASQPMVQADPYDLSLDKAFSALSISKSAQSADDWQLAANQWQEAIALMKRVPRSSPNRMMVRDKLAEFEQQLILAQQQVKQLGPNGMSTLVLPSPAPQTGTGAPDATNSTAPQTDAAGQPFYQVPIKRRSGNTPVISVTFNGNQAFDMIVDTGASSTVITPRMATAMGVVPVETAIVDTASAKGLEVPVGYVEAVEAGGLVKHRIQVVIANSDLDVGLLGHNFFGDYDITIKQDVVEFKPRN